MKSIKKRLLSLLLTLITILSLLPTSAFAASGTGKGITITKNQNYWSTRLLANGTPYSYRPPMAAGRLLYCLDSGLGYHNATQSFFNSYTYTSATNADADTVLKTAIANSGLGEMDAATLANVKWLMTYINDSNASNVGQLFMAVQTYVWDHQSYKGEPGGDGDAGGYANADTYEMYLSLIDWMLAQKAQEDAAFQRQIEEYAVQGKVASIVETDSAKWAVFALSSNRKNQSFFNYYGPRELVVKDAPQGGDEPAPPAGDADITLQKVAAGTTRGLDGAKFNIYRDGQIVGSDVTKNGGMIEVKDVTEGLWSFVETEAPAGYCADSTPISVYVDTTDGNKQYTVTATNYELPSMKIIKTDAQTGAPIPGTVLSIKSVTGSYSTSVTTGTDGSATLSAIPAGVYVVREESVPEPYIVSNTEQTVALRPGKTSEVTFVDYEKPGLEILKKNIATGEPIEGVTYLIEQIDGSYSTRATTDSAGRIFLDSIPVGSYRITEKNVPSHVILSEIPQEVYLEAGCTRTVTFFNAVKPSLTILKRNSVTGDPLSNAKFHIYYGSDNTTTGEINDLGVFTTDEIGKITLTDVNRGWYKLVEESAPKGFGIQGSGVTEFYLEANTSKTVTVDNVPHSALVVYKYDAKTGKGLEGCRFELRYLSGNTSGTGGTVIGTYVTGPNGAFTVTNLKKGTYVCQELESDGNHIIDREPQTVWISGEDQDVVTLRFGNAPLGSLLITKLSDDSKHEPLSGVEFLLTDSSGHYLGNDNGRFTTNAAGEILVDGLEPGMTVIAREVRAKTGYLLDDSPQHALIKSGETAHLQFLNQPAGNLIIRKVSSGPDGEPLEGVEFKITYADGSFVPDANGELSSNGIYYTNKSGEIRISGIVGTVIATETKTISGFTIDEATRTQTVVVNPNDTQTLTFYNKPTTTLIIQKYISGTKNEPLAGVQFLVTDSSGTVVGPNNGYYTSDSAGQIVIEGLTDGITVTTKEVKTADGFVLDGTPQSIKIDQSQSPQRLTFWNERQSALELIKVNAADKTQRIPNTTFEIRRVSNGGLVDTVTTGTDGRVYVPLESGSYYAVETEAGKGFLLDSTPIYFTVEDGKTTTKTVTNKAVSGILIHKIDSTTGEGIYGVSFILYDSGNNPIAQETSDDRGYVRFEGLTAGRYSLRELENEGYIPDTQRKTVYVRSGETTEIEWKNTPITGQIQIVKTSADYNSMNGWPAGTPIPNTVFEVYNARTNRLVDTIRTNKSGRAVSKPLPLGRYKIVESKAAEFYGLDKTPIEVEIEYAGQIVKAAMTNKSLYTNVSIKKTGYVEVMPGQLVRYNFTSIANNSTTALESFYWRDTLPTSAVRIQTIYTGTWNTPGSYKVVYRTNLSGDTWRTLADNLSTSKNYVLDASPAALGLASNEYVTEFMAAFGIVHANFRQVEAPRVDCKVLTKLNNGTQFTNQADAGGVYNGQWIMAASRWVTRAYAPSKPLPRTGY